MQTKTTNILFIFCLIFLISCKNSNTSKNEKQTNPFESAMPHGESLQAEELSEEDKIKLANAKGKSTIPLNENQLDSLFNQSKDYLHIYSFYKIDDPLSQNINKHLLNISKELGEETFNLIFFNIDSAEKKSEVITQIRQSGVTSDIFSPSDSMGLNWFSKINPNWLGEVPAIYLLNKTDGTNLFYQKEFSKDELLVIIQSLTM